MTSRLYYTEPYLTAFDAHVVSCEPVGAGFHVLLDRSAFYPTSGGQPFDTGTIGGVAVSDVIDRDDGEIAHVVSTALAPGIVVQGFVDWSRRFEHMQQHTGQHVLSAVFDRLCQARTESFHMGTAASTIDLGRVVSAEEIGRVEEEANRIVWEDRPVTIRFASPEEAAALPLRKETARTGPLRLIEVQDCDLSACGGTHVASTGGIGTIAIGGWEKFRGGTRVSFLCGVRALDRFRHWRDALAAVQRHLSVAPDEMAGAIERLQDEAKTLNRAMRGLQERLATFEAQSLLSRATRDLARIVIVEALEGWDANGLKAMAMAAVAAEPTSAVALFTTTSPALAVIARGPGGGVDAGAALKSLITRFGGKGGGKPDLAQGGGLVAPTDQLITAARELLKT